MDYTIPAIPTTYKGRNYRSRLEAKWAAFFDLCGWRYEYEPVDFNGWFPDFAIYGERIRNPILVEVKPVKHEPFDIEERIGGVAHQYKGELLVLGDGPWEDGELSYLGWLLEYCEGSGYHIEWREAVFSYWGLGDHSVPGFCHMTQDWTDRITGLHTGSYGYEGAGLDYACAIWAKAANKIQYRHSPSVGRGNIRTVRATNPDSHRSSGEYLAGLLLGGQA